MNYMKAKENLKLAMLSIFQMIPSRIKDHVMVLFAKYLVIQFGLVFPILFIKQIGKHSLKMPKLPCLISVGRL